MNSARAALDAVIREATLHRQITDLATLSGRRFFHDEDARRNNPGFPDLVIPVAPVLFLWELKTARGRLRPDQEAWRDALLRCSRVEYRTIRPGDWDYVQAVLGGPGTAKEDG